MSASHPPGGYHGRCLLVDLTGETCAALPLGEDLLRNFIGGVGLGTALLLRHGAAALDPLAPEAPSILAFSPLVCTPLTTTAKFALVGKSPLTGRINDSLASGRFAFAGKQCGCDALLITGRAERPSILVLDDDRIRLEPAEGIWGLSCSQAAARIETRLGAEYAVALIGPAGEAGVRYAAVCHDGRYAGRGGHGSVWGAKNLKAVALRGSHRVAWAQPDALRAAAERLAEKSLGPGTLKYRELGTAENLLLLDRLGMLPTRNFQQGTFAGAAALAPEQLRRHAVAGRKGCVACTIGCEHFYTPQPGAAAQTPIRVEYEGLFALGSLCGVSDPAAVLTAVERANELGLDVISAGGVIAFSMECVERGLLDCRQLQFGRAESVLWALEQIARREGVGALMAEGSRRMAQTLGGDALSFAPQVKGLELPGYDPRALQTTGLGLAVAARGADHNRSGAHDVDFSGRVDARAPGVEAVAAAIKAEDRAALLDSLILCKFLRRTFVDYFGELSVLLNLVTGWNTTPEELRTTSARIVTAKKLFNIQAGWQPAEDRLPERFLREPLPGAVGAALSAADLETRIAQYRHLRGWTAEGGLPPEVLSRLDLADFAQECAS